MTPSATTTAAWIVCRSVLRLASGGLVACPVGRTTSIDDCLACRFLEDIEDERDEAYSCATDAINPDRVGHELFIGTIAEQAMRREAAPSTPSDGGSVTHFR